MTSMTRHCTPDLKHARCRNETFYKIYALLKYSAKINWYVWMTYWYLLVHTKILGISSEWKFAGTQHISLEFLFFVDLTYFPVVHRLELLGGSKEHLVSFWLIIRALCNWHWKYQMIYAIYQYHTISIHLACPCFQM
jgi:hypothetical protein